MSKFHNHYIQLNIFCNSLPYHLLMHICHKEEYGKVLLKCDPPFSSIEYTLHKSNDGIVQFQSNLVTKSDHKTNFKVSTWASTNPLVTSQGLCQSVQTIKCWSGGLKLGFFRFTFITNTTHAILEIIGRRKQMLLGEYWQDRVRGFGSSCLLLCNWRAN